ncbi:CLUMA_CG018056, isoform A [Clunio marinus]|uniref:Protein cereblon n=1 Tax=Clunio marinus TaxID=568069 RepID=A0A1J1J052_9DIPT|nr:CLUMA_CG018056, isoform A [Clunio marinus]
MDENQEGTSRQNQNNENSVNSHQSPSEHENPSRQLVELSQSSTSNVQSRSLVSRIRRLISQSTFQEDELDNADLNSQQSFLDLSTSDTSESPENEDPDLLFEEYVHAGTEAVRSQARNFDDELPMNHSYLGTTEECRGTNYYEPGRVYEIPIHFHHSLVFPGEIFPMIVIPDNIFARIPESNEGLTFGLLFTNEIENDIAYGVTCQVFEKGVDSHGHITIKSKAQQRFIVVRTEEGLFTVRNQTYYSKVRILPEYTLPEPIAMNITNNMMKFNHNTSQTQQIKNQLSHASQWPKFVYDQYSTVTVNEKVERYLAMLSISAPDDPLTKSFWLARNVPLNQLDRLRIFTTNCVNKRMLLIGESLNFRCIFNCKRCANKIANYIDIFAMAKGNVNANYCNPAGYIHETLTVHKTLAESTNTNEARPCEDFSWFPGYAWQIANCKRCNSHVGWKFIAVTKNLKPKTFYGLSCKSLVVSRDAEENFTIEDDDDSSDENIKMSREFILLCHLLCHLIFMGSSFELELNDPCTSSLTNSAGICVDPRNCEQFKAHRREMNICSFVHRIPIICCPRNGIINQQTNSIIVPTTRPPIILTTRPTVQWGYQPTSNVLTTRPYVQWGYQPTVKPPFSYQLTSTEDPLHNRIESRICEKKCIEYAEGNKKTVQFAALAIGSSAQDVDLSTCDLTTGLIVGGVSVNVGEFPHMAAIGYPDFNGDLSFKCGGSLISEQYVLTVAHCAFADRTRPTKVRLGDLNLNHRDSYLPGIDVAIEKFIPHEEYNTLTRAHDIAVIKMAQSVSFTKNVKPACLYTTKETKESSAIASGWGYTEYSGTPSSRLMKVRLNILSNNLCAQTYAEEDIPITDNQICAGILSGGRDTCQGDSGGPIQVVLGDNKCLSHIVGLTSFGIACGARNAPSVYTRVSSYLDWIEKIVWNQRTQNDQVQSQPRQNNAWQQWRPQNYGYPNFQFPWQQQQQQQQYQNPYQNNRPWQNSYNQPSYQDTTEAPYYTTQQPTARPPISNSNPWFSSPTNPARPTQKPAAPIQQTTRATTTSSWVAPGQNNNPAKPYQKPAAPIQQNQNQGRISFKKCREYSDLLKKKWQVASLSLHSTVQNVVGTDCDAVTGLIVGGVKAKPGEFPHMAAIGYPNLNGDLSFKCGGSLISEYFVLTAAHCSVADRTSPSVVRLGDLNLSIRDQGLPEVDIPIDSFISHESYNKKTRENDIALIKMKQAATFSDDIRPACLQQTQTIEKEKAIATGWGYTEVAGSTSDILQKVQLDIIDNQKCKSVYDDEDNYKIYDSQMCAGVLAGGKDTCGGDSGGPLQITVGNKCVFGIVGVTSYGSTFCGSRNAPGIYTRVSSYIDWIEDKVWGNN